MKNGGNKKNLDILAEYFYPGMEVTLRHKYQSVVAEFYRNLVII